MWGQSVWNSQAIRFLTAAPRAYGAFFNNHKTLEPNINGPVDAYTYPLMYYDCEQQRFIPGIEAGKHGCGFLLSNISATGSALLTFILIGYKTSLPINISASLGAGAVGFLLSELVWNCGFVIPTEMARELDSRAKKQDEERKKLLDDTKNFAPLIIDTSILMDLDSPEPKEKETRGLSTYDTLSDDGDQTEEVAINDAPESPLSGAPLQHSPRSR